ncbi:hypothetical protein ACU8KH_03808 [Lachancea thermotolerans]
MSVGSSSDVQCKAVQSIKADHIRYTSSKYITVSKRGNLRPRLSKQQSTQKTQAYTNNCESWADSKGLSFFTVSS